MSLPGRIIPVQDVQKRMRKIIKHLGSLIRIDHHVEVRGLQVYRPSLQHSIRHHSFQVCNKVTASIVRVDHFEGLEKAVICFRREVACNLGGQDVEVWISGSKLLHRL